MRHAPLATLRRVLSCLALAGLATGLAHAQSQPATQPDGTAIETSLPDTRSATAERVFAAARSRLLQIRSLVSASRSQSSIGSGFLVTHDEGQALAVTNYHVVSEYVLEPDQYTLEWVSTGNRRGKIEVLAVDIAHDLALIRLNDAPTELGTPFALARQEPQRGEKVFSLGRPLDLGFNIVEGTHNGVVEGDFREQFLFSGAINPGMSGGPALNGAGQVYGINVARNLRGQLVSYVVPARFAAALIARVPADTPAPVPAALIKSIAQQLTQRQAALNARLFSAPLGKRTLGHFKVADEIAPFIKCWANSRVQTHALPYSTDTVSCRSDSDLFLGNNLSVGDVAYDHVLIRSREFGALRFDALAASQYVVMGPFASRKHAGLRRCTDDFVTLGKRTWRVAFCASALRKFPGLYLFTLVALSQDGREPDKNGERQALLTRVTVSGASFEDAEKITRRFLEATE